VAKKLSSSVDVASFQEALLQMAAQCTEEQNSLGVEVLNLAGALVRAAMPAPHPVSTTHPHPSNTPLPEALVLWRDTYAGLLAAMAPAADGLRMPLQGEQPSTQQDSLPAMAMALANQSQTASEALQRANQSLREEIASLFREASRHGALERELQLKKVRHAIELGNAKAAQNALDALEFESAQTAHKVKELQERLNLASSTPDEISRLEVEVRQAEASHRDLSKHLGELEEKHSALSAQLRELPERIQKTEHLIFDLQKSRKQALIYEINEIWDRVKRLHEGEGI
jgi:hypothetical protein